MTCHTLRPMIEALEVRQLLSLPGDLNGDGTVSIADFITLASNFNSPGDWSTWLGKLTLALQLVFPYLLYRFAVSFEPLSRRLDLAATWLTGLVVGGLVLLPRIPTAVGTPHGWYAVWISASTG